MLLAIETARGAVAELPLRLQQFCFPVKVKPGGLGLAPLVPPAALVGPQQVVPGNDLGPNPLAGKPLASPTRPEDNQLEAAERVSET
jgi:hypothetical protein